MDTRTVMEVDLELQIEELEPRIAPDSGETFIPLDFTTSDWGQEF